MDARKHFGCWGRGDAVERCAHFGFAALKVKINELLDGAARHIVSKLSHGLQGRRK